MQPILLALSGSRAYQTATDQSDYDYRGVFSQSPRDYLRFNLPEQIEGASSVKDFELSKDTVLYDLKKYLSLANKSNPNILELLWMGDYLVKSSMGKKLISYREKFFTRKITASYVGYAYSQIKRMENHRKWLLNPQSLEDIPKPKNLLPKAELYAFVEFLYFSCRDAIEFLEPAESLRELLVEKIDFKQVFMNYPIATAQFTEVSSVPDTWITLVQENKQYYSAVKDRQNYLSWLKNRNPTRAANEAKVGYDIKHAVHCFRLLFQYQGIRDSRKVIVDINKFPATESGFIKELLQGKVPYSYVETLADETFKEVKSKKIDFPKELSADELSEMFLELIDLYEKK